MTKPDTPVVVQARRLLAAVPIDPAYLHHLRWTIRTDAFDAWRYDMEEAGDLITAIDDYPPRLLGIAYDLGWPDLPSLLTLRITIDEPCPSTPE